MITDSSQDYFAGTITMIFEGEIPTYEEVNEYCYTNHRFRPNFNYTIEPPSEYKGYTNPGTVVVSTREQ